MMKHKGFLAGIFGILLVFGLVLAGCGGDGNTTTPTAPENKPAAERWSKWVADDATVTLDYSVAADGVVTIVVGGTQEAESNKWKASPRYAYTAKTGKKYKYTFEAWAEENRSVTVQYYYDYDTDNDIETCLNKSKDLTTTRQTFTFVGDAIPVGGALIIEFQCADAIGTFYVKMISIEEDTGELGQTFNITGKVYKRAWNSSGVMYYEPLTNVTAVTVNGPFSTAPTVTVTGGSDFAVTIPAHDPSKLTAATKAVLADLYYLSDETKITVMEPADGKFGRLSFSATAVGMDPDLWLSTVSETEESSSSDWTNYTYVYVDKAGTVKGSDSDHEEDSRDGVTYVEDSSTTVDLSFKAGWNIVKYSSSYSYKEISATERERKEITTWSVVKDIPESATWSLNPE